MNENENQKAMLELYDALKCTDNKYDEVETRLLMAVTYNKLNKVIEACKQCQFILKIEGKDKHEGTLKMYAAVLQRMKQYKKSKQIYTELIKNNPLDVTIVTEYISLLVEMKEYEQARKKLQFILSRQPENALELMYEYGLICYKMKDFDKAERPFISIITQNATKFEGAFINLVNIYK